MIGLSGLTLSALSITELVFWATQSKVAWDYDAFQLAMLVISVLFFLPLIVTEIVVSVKFIHTVLTMTGSFKTLSKLTTTLSSTSSSSYKSRLKFKLYLYLVMFIRCDAASVVMMLFAAASRIHEFSSLAFSWWSLHLFLSLNLINLLYLESKKIKNEAKRMKQAAFAEVAARAEFDIHSVTVSVSPQHYMSGRDMPDSFYNSHSEFNGAASTSGGNESIG